MKRYLREHFVHKDGVWITIFGHVNSDEFKITVWQNDKIVEEERAVQAKDAVDIAHELADQYGLPIIDGMDVQYSTFAGEYVKPSFRDRNGNLSPIGNDKSITRYEYSDQDLDDMDERPKQTAKWAICIAPGQFRIYDNVTKNPSRLFDTKLYRGLGGYNLDNRVDDLIEFMDKNSADTYEGTWEDVISTGMYTVLVNGRIYESQRIEKIFDRIIKAGLEVDGNKIHGVIDFTKKNDRGDEIFLNFDDSNDISLDWSTPITEVEDELTIIYDCLTCIGLNFPEEFEMSFREKSYTVLVSDGAIELADTEKLANFRNLELGDVLLGKGYNNLDLYSPKFVIVDIDSRTAKIAKCSKQVPAHSHWYPYYEEKFDIDLYDSIVFNNRKYVDNLETKTISLAKPGDYKLWKTAGKIAQYRDTDEAKYILA